MKVEYCNIFSKIELDCQSKPAGAQLQLKKILEELITSLAGI